MSRLVLSLAAVVLMAPPAWAQGGGGPVTPQQLDAAIKKGTDYLRGLYKDGAKETGGFGLGPAALGGLALLEAEVPPTDPAVQKIAAAVRDRAIGEARTYSIALFVLFLDRL